GTHTDEYIILNGATMHQCIVADRNIAANFCWIFLVGTMDHRAILYVYLVTHFNIVYITPDHGVEPYAAIITHYHITNHGGIGCYKTIFSKLGMFTEN